jgi:hypothetical protein
MSECFAGICGYGRHQMKSAVKLLGIRFPGKKLALMTNSADALEKVIPSSSLERYFGRPTDRSYDQSTCVESHTQYSLVDYPTSHNVHRNAHDPVRCTNLRKELVVCLTNSVNPRNHELFVVRLLL